MTGTADRYTRVASAYEAANGREPAVDILDLLPAIYDAVPDATDEEIVAALRWLGDQNMREAEALELCAMKTEVITTTDLETAPVGPHGERFTIIDGVPVKQIVSPAAEDGSPATITTLAPGGVHGMFACSVIDSSRLQIISEDNIARLAKILHVEPSTEFRYSINDAVTAYAALILADWISPKWFMRFYDDLERDTKGTIEQYKTVPYIAMIIRSLLAKCVIDVNDPALDTRGQLCAAINERRAAMHDLIRKGRPDSRPQTLFWGTVVRIARRYGCDLKLPARDKSRGGKSRTPLFDFADLMRRLLIEQGRDLLGSGGAGLNEAGTRFGQIENLRRGGLISVLEQAKRVILKENQ
jgi:hypothetical protein